MDEREINLEQKHLNETFARIEADLTKFGGEADQYQTIEYNDDFIEARNYRNFSIKYREELNQVKDDPYFAKIYLNNVFNSKEKVVEFYIGKRFYNSNGECLIYDWRSDIGQLFYANNISEYSKGNTVFNLEKKRSIKIEDEKVIDIKDVIIKNNEKYNALTDSFLLDLLEKKRNNHEFTEIIETIQEKQNIIIRHKFDNNILVDGCAGSGKTMIMLHRISFNLFNNKDLRDYKTVVISPSKNYNYQVKKISKDLSIEGIKFTTFDDLLTLLFDVNNLKIYSSNNLNNETHKIDLKMMNRIYSDTFSNNFKTYYNNRFTYFQNKDWRKKIETYASRVGASSLDFEIMSTQDIVKLEVYIQKIKNKNSILVDELKKLEDLRSNTGSFSFDKLLENYNSRVSILKRRLDELNKSIKDISVNYDIYYVNREIVFLDNLTNDINTRKLKLVQRILELKRLILGYDELSSIDDILKEQKNIDNQEYLIREITKELLKKDFDNNSINKIFESKNSINLIIHYIFYSINNFLLFREFNYISIDEIQDYSHFQLQIIRSIFNKSAVFNLYGDIDQAIFDYSGDLSVIARSFGARIFKLEENYRNSEQITEFVNNDLGFSMNPISIKGENVEKIIKPDFEKVLKNQCKERNRIVIITYLLKDDEKLFIDECVNRCKEINSSVVIDVLSIEVTKGLEYDISFVFSKEMNRNMKYIAYTRALNKLFIVS